MRSLGLRVFIAAWSIFAPAFLLSAQAVKKSSSPRVDDGFVSSVDRQHIAVRNDLGSRSFALDGQTVVKSAHSLRRGDSVMVWWAPSPEGAAVATDVLANFTRLAGTVTTVRPHLIRLGGHGGAGEVDGHLTVFLTTSTTFGQGSRADLRLGRDVEVSGYDLGNRRVQATALNVWPH